MQKQVVSSLSAASMIFLSACSPTMHRVAMTQDNLSSIKKIDTSVVDTQKHINPNYTNLAGVNPAVNASLGLAGVLGGALAVGGIQPIDNNKDKHIKPLRAVVHKNEFANDLKEALNAELKKNHTYKELSSAFKIENFDDKKSAHTNGATPDKATLKIPVEYSMSDHYDRLVIKANPQIVRKEKTLKTHYGNALTYSATLKDASNKSDENIQRWADNNGALVHKVLRMAAKNLAKAIFEDMKLIDNESVMKGKREKIVTANGVHYNSLVVSNHPNKVVIRNSLGELIIEEKLSA